jgi:capsid protein
MSRNITDKLVGYFAPERALRRLAARAEYDLQASAYDASNYANRERPNRAWNYAVPGDEEKNFTPADRRQQVLICEDLYRNNEWAGAVVDRLADYVVHTGILPQAQTNNEEWNDKAEDWFWEWAKIADYRQRPGVNLFAFQRQTVIDRFVRGGSGFILMDNGQLFPVELDRVETPEKYAKNESVKHGIRLDSAGRPVGYYVCNRANGGLPDKKSFEFIPRENFIHVMYPWRVDQLREVPGLSRVINKIADIKETDKYVLLKIKNDAKQFLKRTKTAAGGLLNASARGASVRTDANGNQQQVETHDWGQVWNLREGEGLDPFESRSPNQQYVPYLEFQAKVLGGALGIPWEFILMIFTDGSFSAQRSALLHMLHKIIGWHTELNQAFNQRVWNWRIAKAMKAGELDPAPVDANGVSQWFQIEWSLPSMDWVDPEAAADANEKSWLLGSKSLKRIAAEAGQDRDDNLREKTGDIEAAIKQADALNKKYPGANLTWRDYISAGGQKTDGGRSGTAGTDGRPKKIQTMEGQSNFQTSFTSFMWIPG